MTVQTTTLRADYAGNGSTTVFTVPFYFVDATHVLVLKTDTTQSPIVTTTLVLNSDYTVTGTGNPSGGTVTLTAALPTNFTLAVLRNVPLTQLYHYVPNDPFPAASHEAALDLDVMMAQQIQEEINRCLRLSPASSGVSTQLPNPEVLKLIGWNATGTGLQNIDSGTLATVVSFGTTKADIMTGNGSSTDFQLSGNPGLLANLDVSVGGISQLPGVDFVWTGQTTLSFTTAPANGVKILARYAQALSQGSTDSSAASFQQPEAGAVSRSVRDVLRDIKRFSDYGTAGQFNTAAAGHPNIDGSNRFDAPVRPTGEGADITLAGGALAFINQGRARLNYFSDTQIQVYVSPRVAMAGFRFMGQYTKGRCPTYPTLVQGAQTITVASNLGAESAVQANNWYALFACANAGDTQVTFKLMPFLRVGSVAGSVITLNYAGPGANAHAIVAATYTFTNNNMVGCDCLVITEGANNRFSGRVDSITANTTTTVTLNSIGSVGAYDFILPAPPGFSQYVYLGTFQMDGTPAVVNIADMGCGGGKVGSLGSSTSDPNFVNSGNIASPGVQIHWGGYISPLATGIIVSDSESASTGTVSGSLVSNFAHDSSTHLVNQMYLTKADAATLTGVSVLDIPFSIGQFFYYYTTGTLTASRASASLAVRGWFEP